MSDQQAFAFCISGIIFLSVIILWMLDGCPMSWVKPKGKKMKKKKENRRNYTVITQYGKEDVVMIHEEDNFSQLMTKNYVDKEYTPREDYELVEAELKTTKEKLAELELAEKMREPLKTWEVTYGAGWVEEVSAHYNASSLVNVATFKLHDGTEVACFADVLSVKLISTGE